MLPNFNRRDFTRILINREFFSVWQRRRVVITREVISFAFANNIEEIDRIPLDGVDYIKEGDDLGSRMNAEEDLSKQHYILQVATNPEGHNSGRTYYLRTCSKAIYSEIFPLLTNFSKTARERALASTHFRRAQLRVRVLYGHIVCQSMFALIIIGVSSKDFFCKSWKILYSDMIL